MVPQAVERSGVAWRECSRWWG